VFKKKKKADEAYYAGRCLARVSLKTHYSVILNCIGQFTLLEYYSI
jgi:hypothetical protein